MPRQPRLDAPGTLHHVIGRGLEGIAIFQTDVDRADFVARLAARCRDGDLVVYAWALLPNHLHLLVRTGRRPLAENMKKLLTGYVVNFNRRHKRYGHLFQNRYKSIVCEDDAYLLELTRYIHLNPLRAGLVKGLPALRRYPWAGHATLTGAVPRDWQDTDTVLAYFGRSRGRARAAYESYVRDGVPAGRRPDLVGGGLIRSLGGWSQVLAFRRKGAQVASDQRVLGGGQFVEDLLAKADRQEKETLRLARKRIDLATLADHVFTGERVAEAAVRAGSRQPDVVRARRLFCQVAVKKLGHSGAAVARFLGATTSAVNRLAASEELPECGRYLDAL
jgi:REP element-mobilizing transposase RayT